MDEYILNSLVRYFNTLKRTGYINDKEVNKLLALLAILDLAENDVAGELTDCDYEIFYSMINCIEGSSCLFPIEPCNCN